MKIGIFDSGLGGLTVYREIRKLTAAGSIIYFGDTKRTPYGSKSPEIIKEYAAESVDFLKKNNARLIVIACNTINALALDYLKKNFDLPFVDLISNGTKMALQASKTKEIGVLATEATIKSGAYTNALKGAKVHLQACPVFVPLVEEGLTDEEIVYPIAKYYLKNMNTVDTIILGCTHYPFLEGISKAAGKKKLIDPAEETAKQTVIHIKKNIPGEDIFFTSGDADKFGNIGSMLLKRTINACQV